MGIWIRGIWLRKVMRTTVRLEAIEDVPDDANAIILGAAQAMANLYGPKSIGWFIERLAGLFPNHHFFARVPCICGRPDCPAKPYGEVHYVAKRDQRAKDDDASPSDSIAILRDHETGTPGAAPSLN